MTDLFWIGDITVADIVHISKRELELSLLGKYVAGQITKIKEMLSAHPALFAIHNIPFDSLNEAFVCQNRSLYKGFNLIMITSIENIVKTFGKYLIEKQNIPQLSGRKSHSLDAFMKNTIWAEDLEIPISKHLQITGDYHFGEIKPFSMNPTPKRNTVKVSYSTRLQFLGRGFKERRNSLAHGGRVDYEDTVQALINASALAEVLATVIEYQKIYQD